MPIDKNSADYKMHPIRLLYSAMEPSEINDARLYFAEHSPRITLEDASLESDFLRKFVTGKNVERFDVIAVDYPVGWKRLLGLARDSGGLKTLNIPVIAVANQADEDMADLIHDAGAMDFIIKTGRYLPRLRFAIENAYEHKMLVVEHDGLRSKPLSSREGGSLQDEGVNDIDQGERRFRELADILPILVFETDGRGQVTFANRACIDAFGVTEEKFENGVSPLEFVADRDLEKAKVSLRMILNGKELKPERYTARRKDGRLFPTLVSASPIVRDGHANGIRGYLIDMTDLDAAQAATRESEDKFRTLVESSVMGVYIIQDDKFAYVNPAMTRIFGFTQYEFLSLPTIYDVVIPEDRAKIRENIRKRIDGEYDSIKYDFRCRRKTGEVIDVEVFGSRTVFWGRPALIGTLEDVTQRMEGEERLRQSEDRYRTLFDESVDAIYISTPSGKMLDINSAGLNLFGYTSKDEFLNGESLEAFYENPAERLEFMRILEEEGFVRDFETRLRRKDGQILTILDSARVVRNEKGEVTAYRGILRDITERRRLEEQLLQSQKLESLGQLTSGIAHDFNNVLGGIIGFSELALAKINEGSPVYNYLKRINGLADRAAKITKQLLAFARRQILMPKDLNLNELIRDLVELLPRILGEHVEIQFHPGSGLRTIHADPSQIEQVIINLTVNAGDAMPDGGKLTIETMNVFLDEYYCRVHPNVQPGNYVMVSVSDTGTGIDPAVLSRIYEPFFTTKEVGKGTGLGLSVVHGIIRQHGGSINVYSEFGKGTTFRLYFPAKDSKAEKVRQNPAAQETLQPGTETVLVVEDNRDLREFLADLLVGTGYSVVEAGDGEEGVAVFRQRSGEISLIITDVVMPKMSGKELKEKVDAEFPGTKFLFISGYTESVVHHGFVLDQHVDFLQKPFSAFEFSDKVRKILDR